LQEFLTHRGIFGVRVKTGHKNIADDVHPRKTTTCMVTQVGSHLPRSSICAEAGVRKRFCQLVIQQPVFTGITRDTSSVREGLLFWTDRSMTENYTYSEHTPSGDNQQCITFNSPPVSVLGLGQRGAGSRPHPEASSLSGPSTRSPERPLGASGVRH
jgi:hypothetical protein